MPQVGNKKFPYTPAGMKAAKAAAMKVVKASSGMKVVKAAVKKSDNSKMSMMPTKTKKKM